MIPSDSWRGEIPQHVSAQNQLSFVRTNQGHVYVFGRCNPYVCDVSNYETITTPIRMNISFNASRITMGENLLFMSDNTGSVWARGINDNS